MAVQQERRFHESTSRLFNQLAVLGLGALPLAFCLVLSILQFVPAYQSWKTKSLEDKLTAQLGLVVEIGHLETLSPTQVHLHRVRLMDPENSRTLARAQQVEVNHFRDQWLVNVRGAELEGRELHGSWETLHDCFLCRPLQNKHAAVIMLKEARIHTEYGEQQIASAKISVVPSLESTLAWIDFEPPASRAGAKDTLLSLQAAGRGKANQGADATISLGPESNAGTAAQVDPDSGAEMVRLTAKRTHGEVQTTHIQLRIPGAPLPCSLVELWWPAARQFGAAAKLRGVVELYAEPSGQTLIIERKRAPDSAFSTGLAQSDSKGNALEGGLWIEDVDFGSLSWNEPSELTGLGWLWIERAVVGDDSIEALDGVVRIHGGRASGQMLETATAQLGLAATDDIRAGAIPDVAFEHAYFCFSVLPSQLRLAGRLPDGGILADGRGNLVARNAWSPMPLASLVAVLDKSSNSAGTFSTVGYSSGQASHGTRGNASRLPTGRLAKLGLEWLPLESSSGLETATRGTRLSDAGQ